MYTWNTSNAELVKARSKSVVNGTELLSCNL